MKKRTPFVIIFVTLLMIILAGCSTTKVVKEPNSPEDKTAPSTEDKSVTTPEENGTSDEEKDVIEETPDTTISPAIPMSDFFLADGAQAHYQGEGNEFAELDIEVVHPFENYVIVYENNGGAYLQIIYKISENKIEVLSDEIIESDPVTPTLDQLDKMPAIGVYLQQPFTIGTTFEGWTIVAIDATVETPYKKFDNAIVIEMSKEDFVNRKYFVQGIGEVKREAIMSVEGEEDFKVTSMLESIE